MLILYGAILRVFEAAFIISVLVSTFEYARVIEAPLLDFFVVNTSNLISETPTELLTYAPIR